MSVIGRIIWDIWKCKTSFVRQWFKTLIVCALLIACVVLVIYLIMVASNLITTLKKVNKILDDTQTVTGMVNNTAKDVQPVVSDLTDAMAGVSRSLKGNDTELNAISNLAKSVSSMVSIIKHKK